MKVGIIIPYKEDRGYLKYAIASVERQTYSGDIHLIEAQSENTVGVNLNAGIDEALEIGCDIIRYLCDDDTLTPNSIDSTVGYFKENGAVDFMHSKAINRYEGTKREEIWVPPVPEPTLQQMVHHNKLHGGTVAYRASVFKEERFDPDLWTGEEYEFNMRLLQKGFKIGYLPSITYVYRRHSRQKSLGVGVDQRARDIEKERIKSLFR